MVNMPPLSVILHPMHSPHPTIHPFFPLNLDTNSVPSILFPKNKLLKPYIKSPSSLSFSSHCNNNSFCSLLKPSPPTSRIQRQPKSMGGCASRPKELDGKAPEDFTAGQVAPSDATAVAATTTVAAIDSNENVEKENKEVAKLSEDIEPEDKKEAPVELSEPEIEVATVEASEQKAETTKDTPNVGGGNSTTNKDGVKEETKPDEKVSQS